MCSELSWCVNNSEFSASFKEQLINVTKMIYQNLIKLYLKKDLYLVVGTMEVESKRANFLLYSFSNCNYVLGSILVPALLSIDNQSIIFNSTQTQQQQQEHNMYWTTWSDHY